MSHSSRQFQGDPMPGPDAPSAVPATLTVLPSAEPGPTSGTAPTPQIPAGSRTTVFPSADAEATAEMEDSQPASGAIPVTRLSLSAGSWGSGADDTNQPRKTQPRQEVPGYEILGELGRGGMGVVYKARQTRLKRVVALKMILGGSRASYDHLDRFKREAEAVARLQHPNIVQVYEVGEHQGLPFFSLEFVEGGSLDHKLTGTALSPREAAQLVQTLASAMHAAHERGIVHRDLKPANVLLSATGTGGAGTLGVPKVTDFGLAKQLEEDSSQTRSGAIMGTPSYMAPEQALGQTREIGPPADVYALGAILYECLTGRPPFKGESVWDTLTQVQVQDPVAPRQLQPRTPRDLETVCLKCLQKEPGKRYASARELADDLRRFLAGEPIQARPVGRLERTLKWARRRPAQATLVALSVIGLAVLLGGALWYQDQRARSAEKELSDRRRLDGVRREVQEQIDQGRGALARQEWQTAKRCLSVALARASDEPSLAELAAAADQLLPEADRGLQEEGARSADRDRWRRFAILRDDALFHATLATGEGLAANLKATRQAARQAVGLFGVVPERAGPPTEGPSMSEGERAEVVKGCYELLLVLADAEAQALPGQEPDPGQMRKALLILDGAGRLGYPAHPLRAYHLRRARYLEQLGQTRAAAREQERAARRPPAAALDFYLGGEDQYKRGNVTEAVRDFEGVLRLEPGHFWAQYFLSVGYLRLQRPGEARAGLTACLGQRPDFVWIYLLRAFAHIQLQEFEAAEADFQKASAILRQRPSVDAEHVLYANRGVLRLQQGQLDSAVADLTRAIRLKGTEYQAHATLAQVYQKQKHHDLALAQLDRAIQLEPDLAFLYRLRAQVQTQRQALGAALEDLGQASRKESGAPSLTLARDHAQRGRILYRLKRYQEAVEAYGEAVKADSHYASAYLGSAEALLKLGRYEEGLAALERYEASGGKPVAEAWRTRGLVRAKLRQYPEALRDLTQALEIKPQDAGTRAQRGWVYLGCNAPQLALLDFDEALRRDPAQGDAYNGRGHARVQLGQYASAVLDAEEALRRGPSTPQRLIDSARILAQASGRLEAEGLRQARPVPEAARQYRDQALALLLQALTRARTDRERASLWQERIDPDPAFDPIRGSSEFARLRVGGAGNLSLGRE